jgi:NADH-quinone oxidoreductase subunit C
VTPGSLREAFPGAAVEEGFGPLTVDVPVDGWVAAVTVARDLLGCAFFDFLTAVDEPDGLRVVCHLACLEPFAHLVLRTSLSAEQPELPSVASAYAGAGWHERETAEMFGITFLDPAGDPLDLPPLLLPPGFEGHPLRKDHELSARLERPWPGATDPGSSS